MSRGQTGFVPGTNPRCPKDKPRFSAYFTPWKPSLPLAQTQFVLGTIPGSRGDRKCLCLNSSCAFFAREYSGEKSAPISESILKIESGPTIASQNRPGLRTLFRGPGFNLNSPAFFKAKPPNSGEEWVYHPHKKITSAKK